VQESQELGARESDRELGARESDREGEADSMLNRLKIRERDVQRRHREFANSLPVCILEARFRTNNALTSTNERPEKSKLDR
jgi:hypothetical protein